MHTYLISQPVETIIVAYNMASALNEYTTNVMPESQIKTVYIRENTATTGVHIARVDDDTLLAQKLVTAEYFSLLGDAIKMLKRARKDPSPAFMSLTTGHYRTIIDVS